MFIKEPAKTQKNVDMAKGKIDRINKILTQDIKQKIDDILADYEGYQVYYRTKDEVTLDNCDQNGKHLMRIGKGKNFLKHDFTQYEIIWLDLYKDEGKEDFAVDEMKSKSYEERCEIAAKLNALLK